ncbi:HEAT repeat domain-containing protein [Dactylosporangium sp. NPDC049742]|uniref:HEAT repeat domain-containing protein n=1 Tax=Dactylosporangium sp. NPDC049742 TaxID=3154737 RepID=UPI003446E973
MLRRCAVADPADKVRRCAIDVLAGSASHSPPYEYRPGLWRDRPGVVALVRERALDDPSPLVRRACLETLAAGWTADPQVRSMLRERAVADPDCSVRTGVWEALVRRWPADPSTVDLLRERAAAEPTDLGRRNALRVLAEASGCAE